MTSDAARSRGNLTAVPVLSADEIDEIDDARSYLRELGFDVDAKADADEATPSLDDEAEAWRSTLATLRPRRVRVIDPARVVYQRAPLSREQVDRATLRAVDGEGPPVVRVDVIERDRTGEHGWSPSAWTEYARERTTPEGEGLGLVRSWQTRPRPASRARLMVEGAPALPAMFDPIDRDAVWTLYTSEGEALVVITGGPDELFEGASEARTVAA